METRITGEYVYVQGERRRSKKKISIRGLNKDHNHDLKGLFKGAATRASVIPGPFREFYQRSLAKGIKPTMVRLTLARKIAAITLTLWKKGANCVVSFTPVWLSFWTFGGIMVITWLIHPGPSTPRGFLSLWLTFWVLAEAWAMYWWLWAAYGKEVVTIREGALAIRRDILGYGRTRDFPIGSVRNLRASGFFPSNSYWDNYLVRLKLAGGTVGFDVQGQVKKFGIQLTEPEAQEVVRELKPYLPN